MNLQDKLIKCGLDKQTLRWIESAELLGSRAGGEGGGDHWHKVLENYSRG